MAASPGAEKEYFTTEHFLKEYFMHCPA